MKPRNTFIRIDSNPIPINGDELRLYCVIRNERSRIKFFLNYYQNLGVDRFIFIDNNSTDKVEHDLLKYSNVHVFQSTAKFYQAKAVHLKKIVNTFSKNSWCLIIDADEFLRFPFDSTLKLKGLVNYLEHKKTYAFKTLLLDMYSNRKVIHTHYRSGENPFEICQYFDQVGYIESDGLIYGGVRNRVFGLDKVLLTKYPLFKNIPDLHIKFSDVHLNPGVKNIHTTGVLFHFKFFDTFAKRAQEEVQRQEHWRNASEYKTYIQKDLSSLQLYSIKHSVKFKNFFQLYAIKLVELDLLFLFFVCRWKIHSFIEKNTATNKPLKIINDVFIIP